MGMPLLQCWISSVVGAERVCFQKKGVDWLSHPSLHDLLSRRHRTNSQSATEIGWCVAQTPDLMPFLPRIGATWILWAREIHANPHVHVAASPEVFRNDPCKVGDLGTTAWNAHERRLQSKVCASSQFLLQVLLFLLQARAIILFRIHPFVPPWPACSDHVRPPRVAVDAGVVRMPSAVLRVLQRRDYEIESALQALLQHVWQTSMLWMHRHAEVLRFAVRGAFAERHACSCETHSCCTRRRFKPTPPHEE